MYSFADPVEKLLQLTDYTDYDVPIVPLPHAEKCKRMFRDIVQGITCAYLRMEDANELYVCPKICSKKRFISFMSPTTARG